MWSVCEKILLSRSEIKSLQIMDLRDIQYVKSRSVHHALAAAAQKTAFCVTDMFSLLFLKSYQFFHSCLSVFAMIPAIEPPSACCIRGRENFRAPDIFLGAIQWWTWLKSGQEKTSFYNNRLWDWVVGGGLQRGKSGGGGFGQVKSSVPPGLEFKHGNPPSLDSRKSKGLDRSQFPNTFKTLISPKLPHEEVSSGIAHIKPY